MRREAAALVLGIAVAIAVFYPLYLLSPRGEVVTPQPAAQAVLPEAKRAGEVDIQEAELGEGRGLLITGADLLVVSTVSLAVAGALYVAARRRVTRVG